MFVGAVAAIMVCLRLRPGSPPQIGPVIGWRSFCKRCANLTECFKGLSRRETLSRFDGSDGSFRQGVNRKLQQLLFVVMRHKGRGNTFWLTRCEPGVPRKFPQHTLCYRSRLLDDLCRAA